MGLAKCLQPIAILQMDVQVRLQFVATMTALAKRQSPSVTGVLCARKRSVLMVLATIWRIAHPSMDVQFQHLFDVRTEAVLQTRLEFQTVAH